MRKAMAAAGVAMAMGMPMAFAEGAGGGAGAGVGSKAPRSGVEAVEPQWTLARVTLWHEYYVDMGSVSRAGAWRRAEALLDYARSASPQGDKSVRFSVEIDCAKSVFRAWNFRGHAGAMGEGPARPRAPGDGHDRQAVRPFGEESPVWSLAGHICDDGAGAQAGSPSSAPKGP